MPLSPSLLRPCFHLSFGNILLAFFFFSLTNSLSLSLSLSLSCSLSVFLSLTMLPHFVCLSAGGAQFMPQLLRENLDRMLTMAGIFPPSATTTTTTTTTRGRGDATAAALKPVVEGMYVSIGSVRLPVSVPDRVELVPRPLFFDIPQHTRTLQQMMQDLVCGERHLLLIGNQA